MHTYQPLCRQSPFHLPPCDKTSESGDLAANIAVRIQNIRTTYGKTRARPLATFVHQDSAESAGRFWERVRRPDGAAVPRPVRLCEKQKSPCRRHYGEQAKDDDGNPKQPNVCQFNSNGANENPGTAINTSRTKYETSTPSTRTTSKGGQGMRH